VNILEDTRTENPRQKILCLKTVKYQLIVRGDCTYVIDRGT
jgi:hypothetical protein